MRSQYRTIAKAAGHVGDKLRPEVMRRLSPPVEFLPVWVPIGSPYLVNPAKKTCLCAHLLEVVLLNDFIFFLFNLRSPLVRPVGFVFLTIS